MRYIKYLLIGISLICNLNATTVYENAEDGEITGWRIQPQCRRAKKYLPAPTLNSRVIKLQGDGGPWILGAVSGDLAWNNGREKTISWKMLTGGTIYCIPPQ